jgi:hypothetical protein
LRRIDVGCCCWSAFVGASLDIMSCTSGGKMGSSGCRIIAVRSKPTSFCWVRVVKYARFYKISYNLVKRVKRHTSSIDNVSAATRLFAPSTKFCFDRMQGPQSHSFSRTVTTSLLIGG